MRRKETTGEADTVIVDVGGVGTGLEDAEVVRVVLWEA